MRKEGEGRKIEKLTADFAVIGGGTTGICAAVAAARHGCKVILVNDRPVLGGNCSSEIGVNINGAAYNALYSPSVYARETGIMEEIKQNILQMGNRWAGKDAAFLETVYEQENIKVLLNTYACKVNMDGDTIRSVTCLQLTTERAFEIEAPIFADCTGDGSIAYFAGAEYMWGNEARSAFNESLAPEIANPYTNGTTILFTAEVANEEVKYVRPSFAHDITKLSFFKDLGTKERVFARNPHTGLIQGQWWIEFGGHMNTIHDHEDIVLELRKLVYGFWDYIKNSGEFPESKNWRLVSIYPMAGKRESRRFVGDYIINQNDVLNKVDFEDSVYIGGWPMDLHASFGIYDTDRATYWHFVYGMFNVPYRTLYSKDVKNLFFAGRNTSCTHAAHGSLRVAATCGAGGQAVGTAASLCKKYATTPRGVYQEHLDELVKTLVKDDQTIVNRKEEYPVKAVSVSSSKCHVLDNPAGERKFELKKSVALALPIVDVLDEVTIFVTNKSFREQTLQYRVLGGSIKECFYPEEVLSTNFVNVPANFEGELALTVNGQQQGDGKLYLMFNANENLALGLSDEVITGAPSFTAWDHVPTENDPRKFGMTRMRDVNIAFTNVQPVQKVYEAENVLSGWNRPYKMPNVWISEGKENAWLEVQLDAFVNEIQLVFDTDLAEDAIYTRCKKLIKDYRIELTMKDGTKKTIEVEDNYKRINAHSIGEEVATIKFVPVENYGSANFDLFGIKLY